VFWSDDIEKKPEFEVPDDIMDVAFSLSCKTLPIEHAHALSIALQDFLPWLPEEEGAGVHLIHVAESGNGWMRPEDPENEVLCVSRRTKMTLRLPKERIDEAKSRLLNQTLDIEGHSLTIGEGSEKPFVALPTLFSRYVVTEEQHDEMAFLQWAAEQLKSMNIPIRKMMAGKQNAFKTPEGPIYTRSLMIAELEPEHSVLIQQRGMGPHRHMGCGLFMPQKGIKAVNSDD
jgi:CRISPR-associated protein Cas6